MPGAPSALMPTASGSSVSLSWASAASGRGGAVGLHHRGREQPDDREPGEIVDRKHRRVTFSASGVGSGVYYVRVRAINGAGISGPTPDGLLVVGTPPPTPAPGAPTNLVATWSGHSIALAWEPADDGGLPVLVHRGSWLISRSGEPGELLDRHHCNDVRGERRQERCVLRAGSCHQCRRRQSGFERGHARGRVLSRTGRASGLLGSRERRRYGGLLMEQVVQQSVELPGRSRNGTGVEQSRNHRCRQHHVADGPRRAEGFVLPPGACQERLWHRRAGRTRLCSLQDAWACQRHRAAFRRR